MQAADLLSGHTYFQQVPRKSIVSLCQSVEVKVLRDGQPLAFAGDPIEFMCVIVSGIITSHEPEDAKSQVGDEKDGFDQTEGGSSSQQQDHPMTSFRNFSSFKAKTYDRPRTLMGAPVDAVRSFGAVRESFFAGCCIEEKGLRRESTWQSTMTAKGTCQLLLVDRDLYAKVFTREGEIKDHGDPSKFADALGKRIANRSEGEVHAIKDMMCSFASLGGMPGKLAKEMARCALKMVFQPGEVIAEEGEITNKVLDPVPNTPKPDAKFPTPRYTPIETLFSRVNPLTSQP
jgi:CRP-like cAMP-binding protein